jgi:RNA polymerase sigma-54 factor
MAMGTELGMNLNVEQKQVLSPQLIQSAKILQMNAQELADYVNEAALENPVIDVEEKKPEDRLEKYEWLNSYRDRGYTSLAEKDPDDEDSREDYNFDASRGESLGDYLRAQLVTMELTERENEILDFMIESLDSAGYFKENLDYVVERYKVSKAEAEKLLGILQSLEPAGVGARNVAECLRNEALRRKMLTPALEAVILRHLTDVAKNHLPAIAKEENLTLDAVKEACEAIRRLNPKPGNSFSDRQQLRYITPDVLVVRFPDHTDILLNDSMYPGIGINSYYSRLFKESQDPEVHEYLDNKIRQAEWIRTSIERRDDTLLRIAKQIYLEQREFFTAPGAPLKPLRLADVAEALGVHESTVSRALRGKYLQCPRGVYPLSYFFPGGAADRTGGASSDAVRQKIREIIGAEDREKPLSDQKIADKLAAAGVAISRRAVAKYRDEMKIPAAAGRREY